VPAFDRTEYAIQIVLTTSGLSVVAWGVQQGQAARLAGAGAGAETLCFWLGCTEESKPSLLDTHTPGRSSDSFLVLYGEVAFAHHRTIFRLTNGLTRYDDDKQRQDEQQQDER
jgi:hypothetical protein